MPLDILLGAQWGDEGKGRITDLLAARAQLVARFAGGDNAGHTVTLGEQIFKLHLIPSGVLNAQCTCALGGGMVINPRKLIEELDQLNAAGINVSPERVKISPNAHIITPAHLALDDAQERARGEAELGTTRRGIGPAYTDKTSRRGIRAGSMRDPVAFADLVMDHLNLVRQDLLERHQITPTYSEVDVEAYRSYAERLRSHLADVSILVDQALKQGLEVLAEGAQGTLLDLDHGTYPFVTSSHPTLPGALLGLGVGSSQVRRVLGVTKAYQTRVGEGPFPTELTDSLADRLRGSGDQPWHEYGTTTGRPRRVGWLDLVLLRYAVRVNGFTELALTKLDVLSGMPELRVCQAYKLEDEAFENPSSPMDALAEAEPVYESLAGWEQDISRLDSWEHLPTPAREFVIFVEHAVSTPIRSISVGPERHQIIHR